MAARARAWSRLSITRVFGVRLARLKTVGKLPR